MNRRTNKPLISVVMPVYNAGNFLLESVSSIISQSYKNWELIAVNDHSGDESLKILQDFARKDKRIRVFSNKRRMGVSATTNFALSKVKGQFVARMDADDISLPNRLDDQLNFLLKNTDVIALGGQCDVVDSMSNKIGEKRFPTKFEEIKKLIFLNIPLQQPSMMVNLSLLPDNFVWYDKNVKSAEEMELLFKFFKLGRVVNLDEKVLKYRIHGSNTSLVAPKKTFYLTIASRIRGVYKYGFVPSMLGVLVSLAQIIAITLLPEKLIYPVYAWVKGITGRNATMDLEPSLEVDLK